MEYTLKDKIPVTNDFIKELCDKSWQEVEHLQSQLVNLETSEDGKKVSKLIQNLLTGYYVFIGGLENLDSIDYKITNNVDIVEPEVAIKSELELEQPPVKGQVMSDIDCVSVELSTNSEVSEPFEYFVDFDEPVGEPLTDKDLYN
jgi:hypothetical protein